MKERERDIIRRTILELVAKGNIHYTDLETKVNSSGHSFATTNTFKWQFHYLLSNNYIDRISRGVYQITSKGKQYLALGVLEITAETVVVCNVDKNAVKYNPR